MNLKIEMEGIKVTQYKKVVYKDGVCADIRGYSIREKLVSLHYHNPTENLSGFSICDESGRIMRDCSDFVYRWDTVDQKPDEIWYTNDKNYRQTEPWSDLSSIMAQEEALSNEELTEAVADLMYEVSMAQLGL